jgi:F-type H+-transporting ATPase subunit gamma
MVSASKLRRAQDRVISGRPYAALLEQMLANIAAAVSGDERVAENPLLAVREEKRILLVLVTSDKGLAGAFNSNLIKGAQQFMTEHAGAAIFFETIGRKGRDFFRKRGANISGEYVNVSAKMQYSDTAEIARKAMDMFRREQIDSVYLIYNEFKTVASQKLTVKRVLPVALPEKSAESRQPAANQQEAQQVPTDYIYEQPPPEILAALLPRYVEVEFYRALAESTASEHAARMMAMEAATSNASDMIDRLTLYMNRVRQASITKEIIEVVSGAAAAE